MVALLPRLRRFCVGLAGTLHDGDDLAQQTCERATSRIHQWQPGTRLDSWMFRIAQNLWINQVKSSHNRRMSYDEDYLENVPGTESEETMTQSMTLRQTLGAMQKLTAEHREILMLVCVEGYSYAETADILSVQPGTVMSRLARARENLRNLLREPSALVEQ